ncbi:DnaD domain-containing protein [Oceanobacillus alkalisoli]|uniref:DnaD domain-containing protein n=1 Tax=Oceanobacillus alkalisoli TaxID=2925113 RepID=UPI001F1198E7|nr:DnaD domain protein [Oceanobacillus alkalisoli]MCF3944897.1 DnaD domain protein [Oceanobacillus alkalisoli]
MTKLNFHREKNMLMDWLMLNDMSTGEIALWHTLMNMGNRLGQQRVFNAPASTLMRLTGLSKQGMYNARQKLEGRGMIRFEKGSRSRAAIYEMIPLQEVYGVYGTSPISSGSAPMESRNLTQQLTKKLTIHKEKVKEKRGGGSSGANLHPTFIMYEENINKLTPLVKRDLHQWIHAVGRAVVEEAIHITVKKGGRTFSYTEAILNEWESNHLKTVEEIRRYEAERGLKNRKKYIHMPGNEPETEEQSLEEWAREVFQ